MRVLVWNEGRHEQRDPRVRALYPTGIGGALGEALAAQGHRIRLAAIDDPAQGLGDEALAWAEVVVYWAHLAHDEVEEERVAALERRVREGLGLVVLHSGHHSKIFRRLMGTSCDLRWREADDRERIWVVDRAHPIARGLPPSFELANEEMYGEPTTIPQPEELVLVSWFSGGEIFLSGGCYRRGSGRIFYFRPGHELFPTYHAREVQAVIANAVAWAGHSD